MRIREIKRLFTVEYKQQFELPEVDNDSRIRKNEAAIW